MSGKGKPITVVQRRGMEAVFTAPSKRMGADCAFCRSSQVRIHRGAFSFVCRLIVQVVDGSRAKTCVSFRDSRKSISELDGGGNGR